MGTGASALREASSVNGESFICGQSHTGGQWSLVVDSSAMPIPTLRHDDSAGNFHVPSTQTIPPTHHHPASDALTNNSEGAQRGVSEEMKHSCSGSSMDRHVRRPDDSPFHQCLHQRGEDSNPLSEVGSGGHPSATGGNDEGHGDRADELRRHTALGASAAERSGCSSRSSSSAKPRCRAKRKPSLQGSAFTSIEGIPNAWSLQVPRDPSPSYDIADAFAEWIA